ncbi:MAG TPA: phosphopantetheine-binding protein [Verrucomicrobiae bacterium]|jgi:acyl carrier protein
MTRDQIVTSLKHLLKQQKQVKLNLDSITDDTRLQGIGFDSLSILDFIYDVESHFNARIEMADLVRMERVKDLIDYLHAKVPR